MSDSFPTTTPQPPAAAPEAPAPTPEPAAPPVADQQPAGSGVNPAWDRALEHIPEAWRKPIYDEIGNFERERQSAIEKARQAAAPEEWQDLLSQAKEAGLTPDELIDAYNGQIDMRERIAADPDGFLEELGGFIDRQVAAGVLTRKQGQQAKKDAQSAVDDVDDDTFETPEAKAIKELQARLDADAEQRRVEQERQQQEAQTRAEREYAAQFMNDFDTVMEENGFIARGADGKYSAVLPGELQQQIAYVADAILEAEPRLSQRDAIVKATTAFREQMTKVGAQLPAPTTQQPAGRQQIPVIGGGASNIPPAQQQPKLEGDARSAEIVRMMREMQGQG